MSPLRRRLPFLLALLAILGAGAVLRARWRDQLVDRGIGGDGLHYWHVATHIEREHMISFDGKEPVWTRLPGYAAFLALTTAPAISEEGANDPLAIKLRVDAWLRRLTRVNLAVDLAGAVAILLLALAIDAGFLSLLGALAWALQPWTSVIAIHPLSDDFAAVLTCFCLAAIASGTRTGRARDFAIAGILGGLNQWVRTDAVLLVAPIALAALFTTGSRGRRLGLGAIALGAWVVVFAPWPIRNQVVFGDTHLAGGNVGIDKFGKPLDRSGAFRWLRTWCSGTEDETVRVWWRFPSQPLTALDLPDDAFDSRDERDAVRKLLDEYDRKGALLTPDLAARLDAIAEAHRARHPVDFWLRLPFLRMSRRLFAPRDGYGMGTLPTLRTVRTFWCLLDGAVVLAGILSLVVLSLAKRRVALVLASYLLLRLAMIAVLPVPEPRYFLEALPLLYATAATLPHALRLWLGRTRPRDHAGPSFPPR